MPVSRLSATSLAPLLLNAAVMALPSLLAHEACAHPSTNTVTYQGVLLESGVPIPDGSVTIEFRIYDNAEGGSLLDVVVVNDVMVTGGRFTAEVPLASGVFNGEDRWWGVTYQNVELSPRQKVSSVPYAMAAESLVPTLLDSEKGMVWVRGLGNNRGELVVGRQTNDDLTPSVPSNNAISIVGSNEPFGTEGSVGLWYKFSGAGSAGIRAYRGLNWDTHLQFMLNNFDAGTDNPVTRMELSPEGNLKLLSSIQNGVGLLRSNGGWENSSAPNSYYARMSHPNWFDVGGYYLRMQSTGTGARLTLSGDGSDQRPVAVFNCPTHVPVLVITGADIAERFDVASSSASTAPVKSVVRPGPGMVVSIDPQNQGRLVVSDTPYDTKVCGIISGANGLAVGAVLGVGSTSPYIDGEYPVAMAGRVWAHADESSHGSTITPGDRLTTSDVPGHVMKVMDESRAPGAVIGKAMTRRDEATGMVLVLVNLQ